MAIMPNQLQGLVTQLSAIVNTMPPDCPATNAALEEVAEKILASTRPFMTDPMLRLYPYVEIVVLRLFVDWRVFENIPIDGSISYAELAKRVEAEETILIRYAWILNARRILSQIGEDRVAHTEVSKLYLPNRPELAAFIFYYDEMFLPSVRMPEYFAHYGRREPVTQNHTPCSFAQGQPEKTLWEICHQDTKRMKRVMDAMDAVQPGPMVATVYDFGWVREKIYDAKQQGRMVFVDVGSGKGHITKAILEKNTFIPHELAMIEDRKEVMAEVANLQDSGLAGVKLQAHDFHKEQPVKNALIYFICRCLHNYSDETSGKIMGHLADAMAPDSRLLIAETVMTDPPLTVQSMFDFTMIALGGKERTLKNWTKLAADAGLKLEKVHGVGKEIQIIECVKA